MTQRKTPNERLAEAVYEMGMEEAEKFFNFMKAYGNASKKEKPKPVTRAAAKAATTGGKPDAQ